MEWPFKTVRPDGTVPPPSKIELINTFLTNEIHQDGYVRRSTHGIGKEPSFLRHQKPVKPHGATSQIKIVKVVPPKLDARRCKSVSEESKTEPKSGNSSESEKRAHPLPQINKPVKKPFLITSHSKYSVKVKQKKTVKVLPEVYHSKSDSKRISVRDSVEQPVKKLPKAKVYTGNSRKLDISGKIDKLTGPKEETEGCPEEEFQFSSGSGARPESCLRSYRQVRNGRKRYDVFWSPAMSLTSQQQTEHLAITGTTATSNPASPRSDIDKQSNDKMIPNSSSTSRTQSRSSERKSNLSSRPSSSRSGQSQSTKPKKQNTRKSSLKSKEKKELPKLDLTKRNPLDSDSDYDHDLGKLEILSSHSESGSVSSDASRRLTGPKLKSSIKKTIDGRGDEISESLKEAVAKYVSDIIEHSLGVYQECSYKNLPV